MNIELQDLCYKCLPKEAREKMKKDIAHPFDDGFFKGWHAALTSYFGSHNLTSDTEPEEMLTILRKDITEEYKQATADLSRTGNLEYKGKREILKKLFGSKCLPDKEESKPKFKVGDKVRKTSWDKDTTISMVEWHGTWKTFVYHFKEQEYGFNCHKENDLTIVSKRAKDPNFSIGDKVQLQIDWCRLLKGTLLTIKDIPTIDRDNTFMYSFEETDEYIRETMLKTYTEPKTKNTMEEKELNLAELLKGCEGENLYNPCYGKCVLKNIDKANNNGSQPLICVTLEDGTHRNFSANGKICWAVDKFAPISLFPYSLYEKYPLEPKKAWGEWQENRKPKRWRAENGEHYWSIDSIGGLESRIDQRRQIDIDRYNCGNYFKDEQTASQAADGIREYLKTFHEKILSQNLDN